MSKNVAKKSKFLKTLSEVPGTGDIIDAKNDEVPTNQKKSRMGLKN